MEFPKREKLLHSTNECLFLQAWSKMEVLFVVKDFHVGTHLLWWLKCSLQVQGKLWREVVCFLSGVPEEWIEFRKCRVIVRLSDNLTFLPRHKSLWVLPFFPSCENQGWSYSALGFAFLPFLSPVLLCHFPFLSHSTPFSPPPILSSQPPFLSYGWKASKSLSLLI